MTTESRMREALEGLLSAAECAHAEYRYVRLVGTHHKEPSEIERRLSAQIKIAREALSPPARRTSYEWLDPTDGHEYCVEWDKSRGWLCSVLDAGQWIELDCHVWSLRLAAAIATLANLTKPEEKA